MSARLRLAFTLVEVLIVIAILMLLAAILVPVLLRAKDSGKVAVCTSNLRQVALALELYVQSHDDKQPKYIMPIAPYLGSLAILKCPSDRWGGVQDSETEILGSPVSYYYPRMFLFDRSEDDWMVGWTFLKSADPNHGVILCPLHGELYDPSGMSGRPYGPINSFKGVTLRGRVDGSVERARVDPVCTLDPQGYRNEGRRDWDLATDVRPCPTEVCGDWPIIDCP